MMRSRLLPTPNAHVPEKMAMTREAVARLNSMVFSQKRAIHLKTLL
jgi:hypothetical protein